MSGWKIKTVRSEQALTTSRVAVAIASSEQFSGVSGTGVHEARRHRGEGAPQNRSSEAPDSDPRVHVDSTPSARESRQLRDGLGTHPATQTED